MTKNTIKDVRAVLQKVIDAKIWSAPLARAILDDLSPEKRPGITEDTDLGEHILPDMLQECQALISLLHVRFCLSDDMLRAAQLKRGK